jgi:GTP:adenosylcobinamide-phosphate guanylyltransferase
MSTAYQATPRRSQDPLPTFNTEVEDLTNKMNRQLRRLRSLDSSERHNVYGTRSFRYTTDLAYILNDIQTGPVFFAQQNIRRAMELIGELESYCSRHGATV